MIAGGTVDLGGGTDTLSLFNGNNSINIYNVESIQGGTGNDTIVLMTALTGGTIDLGAGTDTLVLANGANIITIANVETILAAPVTTRWCWFRPLPGEAIDLAGGTDTLTLSNAGDSVNLKNVEVVVGGAGNDTVVLQTAAAGIDDRSGRRYGHAESAEHVGDQRELGECRIAAGRRLERHGGADGGDRSARRSIWGRDGHADPVERGREQPDGCQCRVDPRWRRQRYGNADDGGAGATIDLGSGRTRSSYPAGVRTARTWRTSSRCWAARAMTRSC